jgi:hypothetical protein
MAIAELDVPKSMAQYMGGGRKKGGAILGPAPPVRQALDSAAMPTDAPGPDLPARLSRVALRDRAAFERLYGATCAHLLSVAFRILNNRDRAEEVLQEAFMNVWHSAASYNPVVATPMTWLINIVRNKASPKHASTPAWARSPRRNVRRSRSPTTAAWCTPRSPPR